MGIIEKLVAGAMLGERLAKNQNERNERGNSDLARRQRAEAHEQIRQEKLNDTGANPEKAENAEQRLYQLARRVDTQYQGLLNPHPTQRHELSDTTNAWLAQEYKRHQDTYAEMNRVASSAATIAEIEAETGTGEVMVSQRDININVSAERIALAESQIEYLERQSEGLEAISKIQEMKNTIEDQYNKCQAELLNQGVKQEDMTKLEQSRTEYNKILADLQQSEPGMKTFVRIRDFMKTHKNNLQDYLQNLE